MQVYGFNCSYRTRVAINLDRFPSHWRALLFQEVILRPLVLIWSLFKVILSLRKFFDETLKKNIFFFCKTFLVRSGVYIYLVLFSVDFKYLIAASRFFKRVT